MQLLPVILSAARIARYAWAAPNSAIGLTLGAAAMIVGARVRVRSGALEFAGGSASRWLSSARCRFVAITFGHVILGIDEPTLDRVRSHEQVHVRQYERWGPFFIPVYLLSSFVQLVRLRDPYRDNRFEREARENVLIQ